MKAMWLAALAELNKNQPPDFDLQALTALHRDLLKPQPGDSAELRALRRITLLLAAIFNAIKDQMHAHHFFSYFIITPGAATPNAMRGQLVGMLRRLLSHALAIIHELAELIRGKRTFFDSATFRDSLDARLLGSWDRLVALLCSDPKKEKKGFALFLDLVRNKVAFHFAPWPGEEEELGKAYDTFFSGTGPTQQEIFVSLGPSMEGSRFFFADGAIEQFFQDARAKANVSDEEVVASMRAVNQTLRFVVEHLLRSLSERDGRPWPV